MRVVFAIIFCAFLVSCGNKQAVPKDVLPVKTMTDIMWDNMLADELVNNRYNPDTANKRFDTSVVLYNQVAKLHGTTTVQFKKSMRYYQTRPDLLKVILDTLQRRASTPQHKPATDSLRPA